MRAWKQVDSEHMVRGIHAAASRTSVVRSRQPLVGRYPSEESKKLIKAAKELRSLSVKIRAGCQVQRPIAVKRFRFELLLLETAHGPRNLERLAAQGFPECP